MGIIEQLTEIYEKYETWHKNKMPHEQAIEYHRDKYEKGNIYVYEVNGIVLGYYERYVVGTACFLYTVWVKPSKLRGKVFKELRHHFFSTLPSNVSSVFGERAKLNGKVIERRICHGVN